MDLIDNSYGLFIWQLFILFLIVLWIYCLIDVLRNRFSQNDKVIWLLTVILVPFIGSILYLILGRNKRLKLN